MGVPFLNPMVIDKRYSVLSHSTANHGTEISDCMLSVVLRRVLGFSIFLSYMVPCAMLSPFCASLSTCIIRLNGAGYAMFPSKVLQSQEGR